MADDFNPYRVWLGIPLDEQPPNHYQLLGLAVFEQDPDVIENAANRQMAHVRTFQSGPNAAISQQILNELSEARICLLKSDTKEDYDAQLGEMLHTPSDSEPAQFEDLSAYSATPETQHDAAAGQSNAPVAAPVGDSAGTMQSQSQPHAASPPPVPVAQQITTPLIRTRSKRRAMRGRGQANSGVGVLLFIGLALGVAALLIVLLFLMEKG